MRSVRPRGPRSFRLFGYGLTVLIAAALAWVLFDRAERLAVVTEHLSFDLTVQALRHAVAIRALEAAAEPTLAEPTLADPDRANALAWLEWPAGGVRYLGARSGVDPATIPGGNWYFDLDAGLMVYRVRFADGFRTPLAGPPRIRYAVRSDRQGPGGTALRLVLVEPYTWEIDRR